MTDYAFGAAEFAEDPSATAPAPTRTPLPEDDPRTKLRNNVVDALASLPFYFTSTINIEGLDAGDLFSMNTLLGGAIEIQTVETLNRIRDVWDPDDEWQEYGFQRFSQSFPDVRLIRPSKPAEPALGIELKGWYLLSKEAEPSFRFTATADACSPWDLIAVVPWSLSNVLSGTPRAHRPFVEQARYAAEMRTYYWQHLRRGDREGRNSAITMPQGVIPYRTNVKAISDRPAEDGGGNFGRVARVQGLMTEWVAELLDSRVSGIPAKHWIQFLGTFSESTDPQKVAANVAKLLKKQLPTLEEEQAKRVVTLLKEMMDLLD